LNCAACLDSLLDGNPLLISKLLIRLFARCLTGGLGWSSRTSNAFQNKWSSRTSNAFQDKNTKLKADFIWYFHPQELSS